MFTRAALTMLLALAFRPFGVSAIVLRKMSSMTDASGFAGAFYGDRRIKGQFVISAPLLSALDLYASARDATVAAVSISWGATPGNIVTISVANCTIAQPTPSADNQRLIITADFSVALLGTDTEGDDFQLIFT